MTNRCWKIGRVLLLLLLLTSNYRHASALLPTELPRGLDEAIEIGLLIEPRHNVFVLGTVHIGNESAEEARLLIESVRPSTVVVEMAPSRADKIRRQTEASNSKMNKATLRAKTTENPKAKTKQKPSKVLFETIPALASRGWEVAGVGGMLFSAGMIGGSLLKQSSSLKAQDDATSLPPRQDEFEATVRASDDINATVVFADYELDELISNVAEVMTPWSWLRVGTCSFLENIGWIPRDPILRISGESIIDWIVRRRNVSTARSSRIHGEKTCFELSQILVNARDERFATSCLKAIQEENDDGSSPSVVCIVGLVHLDGVARRLEQTHGQ